MDVKELTGEKYNFPLGVWDEMYDKNEIRSHYLRAFEVLQGLDSQTLRQKDILASQLFLNQGITFTVYSDNAGIERIFPFDIIPRIIVAKEWEHIEKGIQQRLKALNMFLADIYSKQQIIKDKIIPAELISSCPYYTREVFGVKVTHDIYVHISGIDLIRADDGTFYVLEDNLRTPSGVSYMLENREVMKRIFPDMIVDNHVKMISNYPLLLHNIILSMAPAWVSDPTIVLLTPGVYNSAYYEHAFLARQMGIALVEGRDLMVDNHKVFMKTTNGTEQVHVIYRRIDDEFLDPLVFKPSSILGVPGIISAYRRGNVSIINAVGNGVADDKAVYAYVPKMIEYYLNEKQILPNIPTYELSEEEVRKYVFDNIEKMVVKCTNQSGGYGMVMGNKASEDELNKSKN